LGVDVARPNKRRTVGAGENVASNVKALREARGYTPAGLADRMIKNGCPINVSAIYKLEKHERGVDPDELVTLAAVFRVPVELLLTEDPSDPLNEQAKKKVAEYRQAESRLDDARDALIAANDAMTKAESLLELALQGVMKLPRKALLQLTVARTTPESLRERLLSLKDQR
jgi:transcriptional regulator with XRE-family HTH domain